MATPVHTKKAIYNMNVIKLITILITLLVLTSCATIPKEPLVYTPGLVIESLSTEFSISLQTSEKNMSGSGFMVYRRPDKMHMILLSPFGSTVFELFAINNEITLVYPSQGIAFAGHLNQLPDKSDLRGWRMIPWVMDADSVGPLKPNGTYEKLSKLGKRENVTIENGLITTKTNSDNERINYDEYAVVNGVPIASDIKMRSKENDNIRLKLQNPEVNINLSETAFTPRLDGLKIFPLSQLEVQ